MTIRTSNVHTSRHDGITITVDEVTVTDDDDETRTGLDVFCTGCDDHPIVAADPSTNPGHLAAEHLADAHAHV